jgi:hypothetical protein
MAYEVRRVENDVEECHRGARALRPEQVRRQPVFRAVDVGR